nr:hypothetical protein [Tanacetum cinerariifolium]
SAVTYTSISSDSDGLSWGIPLMNAGEFLEMDPYEEVAQQGQDPEEDPEEDPSEEHEPEDDDEDPEEDPNEEHESKGFDETERFKEDKIAVTPPPPRHRRARISVRPQTPMDICTTGPPPRYDVAESSAADAARAPMSQYDFVDIVEAGQGLIRSPGHDTRTIARAADRAEDACYVRALQASERRIMTSIEEVKGTGSQARE